MRYPIWMFMFLFVMPPFAAHALFTGAARIVPMEKRVTVVRQVVVNPSQAIAAWLRSGLSLEQRSTQHRSLSASVSSSRLASPARAPILPLVRAPRSDTCVGIASGSSRVLSIDRLARSSALSDCLSWS